MFRLRFTVKQFTESQFTERRFYRGQGHRTTRSLTRTRTDNRKPVHRNYFTGILTCTAFNTYVYVGLRTHNFPFQSGGSSASWMDTCGGGGGGGGGGVIMIEFMCVRISHMTVFTLCAGLCTLLGVLCACSIQFVTTTNPRHCAQLWGVWSNINIRYCAKAWTLSASLIVSHTRNLLRGSKTCTCVSDANL